YYLRINDADGKAYTTPYAFENTFTPVNDLYEENDTIGAAKLLPESGVVDAFVFPAGDLDWFKIYATAGQQLSLAVTNVPPEMQAIIQIYNQNLDYAWVNESGNNPGDAVYLTYTVPKDGFTYIRINDQRGLSYAAAYRLTVSGGTPGAGPSFNPVKAEKEPNGDSEMATDIPLDTPVTPAPVTGTIDPANDTDWYRFYINSPGIVTISHTNVPSPIISEMWVYNADKTEIGYHGTTNAGDDNVLTLTLTREGYYWVKLAGGQNNVSTSAYTLRVTHTPVVDAGEPNNNNGTATRLGQNTIQGYIFDPADEDWYRVYVREPGNLVISLDAMPEVIKPRLQLYDADRNPKGEWLATNAGQKGDSLVTFAVATPGFYFIQIYDQGYDDGTGYRRHYSASPYTLRITGADFSHTPLLDPIGNRTLVETIPYGFTVHATDPLSELGLVYSASNLPPGAAFDPQTRAFSWTPTRGQAGTYPGVQFTVSDGAYQNSQVITITVQELKRPPLLATIGNKRAFAGLDLTFTVTAADPDRGATLTYSASNLPSGAVFTPATATFHWTPTVSQVGLFKNVKFEVTDGTWTDFVYIDIEVRIADLRGDINGDKVVNLADAILGLQLLADVPVQQSINRGADVNGDGRIGIPEVIYIIQYLSGLQSAVTYNSLITDNFDTLNTDNWWLTRGSNNDLFGEGQPFDASGVSFANGIATLNADKTDQVGVMYSKPLAVTKGDILTIKRRTYLHPANREYGGTLSVYEVADPALSASKPDTFAPLFGLIYYNFDYRTDLNLFSLVSGGKFPYGPGDYSGGTAPQIMPLWNQWFEEEFIYNSGTGDTVYKINGLEKMRTQASPLAQPYLKIMMHSYGWYTGHYLQMDYIAVETAKP
ncbi:MAG: putative Ig domain-containing protein, partial [Deltaproteobacteria bacterium]